MGRFVMLMILAALLVSAKVHNWQTGKVVDTEVIFQDSELSGIGHQTVIITDGDYTYTTQWVIHWRWSRTANLTVNAPVKFAVEKRKLFLVDDDGKQYELDIVKRAAK